MYLCLEQRDYIRIVAVCLDAVVYIGDRHEDDKQRREIQASAREQAYQRGLHDAQALKGGKPHKVRLGRAHSIHTTGAEAASQKS